MIVISILTLWLFNIAMGHGPFIDGLPIKHCGFSIAMLNNQMVEGVINQLSYLGGPTL